MGSGVFAFYFITRLVYFLFSALRLTAPALTGPDGAFRRPERGGPDGGGALTGPLGPGPSGPSGPRRGPEGGTGGEGAIAWRRGAFQAPKARFGVKAQSAGPERVARARYCPRLRRLKRVPDLAALSPLLHRWALRAPSDPLAKVR